MRLNNLLITNDINYIVTNDTVRSIKWSLQDTKPIPLDHAMSPTWKSAVILPLPVQCYKEARKRHSHPMENSGGEGKCIHIMLTPADSESFDLYFKPPAFLGLVYTIHLVPAAR